MFFVDELTPLKLYPVSKKVHIPIDEKDKRNGAAIMLLTPNEDDTIKLMIHPSIVNRKNYISMYADKSVDAIISHEGTLEEGEIIQEGKLSSQERRKLPDSEFGLPDQRKFPLNDKSHVLAAIRMFNHADDSDKVELAKNIKKKIKYFNMKDEINIGKDNDFSKYWNESTDILNEIKFENDKGKPVPKICPKCGSKVGVFFRGEPVFLCSNNKCNHYFGTVSFKESGIVLEDIMFKPNKDGAKFVFCSGTLTAINDASKVLNTSTLKELYKNLNNDKSAKIKRSIKIYIHDTIKEEQEYKGFDDIHCARAYGFDEDTYGPYDLYLKNKLANVVIRNINPDVNDYLCNYIAIWLAGQIDIFKTRNDIYWSGAHAIELTVRKYGVQSIRDAILHNDTSKIMKTAMVYWVRAVTELLPYEEAMLNNMILESSIGNYKSQFPDVKKVVNKLSKKDLFYICGGTFKESPYVIYRDIAYDDKKNPIGFIDVYSLPDHHTRKELDNQVDIVFAVSDDARGKGIASSLINKMLNKFKTSSNLKKYKLIWTVDNDNKTSINLAKKFGFVEYKKNKTETLFIQ